MQKKFFITLILLTLFSLVCLISCGSGNGTTQVSSLVTPTPDPNEYKAYITIKVKWPEGEIPGSCIISPSGNDKEITASMPVGIHKIKFKVFENTDPAKPIGERQILGEGVITSPNSIVVIFIRSSLPFPTVPVTIGAGAFKDPDLNSLDKPIIEFLKDFEIKVGNNIFDLNMGNEKLNLAANPPDINLQPVISSSSLVNVAPIQTSTPSNSYDSQKNYYPIIIAPTPRNYTGETQIIARLVVESPDIPDAASTPFIGKENSNSNNTLESQGVMGLENFEVKFKVIDGDGTLYPIGSQISQEIVSAYTASDGYCNAILKTTQPGNITVQAECELIPGDPNSVITRECYVAAIQPPTPTPEPTSTPEPTATPTPIPIPPYKPYIAGTWQDRDDNKQPSGKSYSITVTQPIDKGGGCIPRIWMGIIVTDGNGQTYEGCVVTTSDREIGAIEVPGLGLDGSIYDDTGFFPGYHTILWWSDDGTWAWTKK